MDWACRSCVPSPLCTREMSLPVVKVASIHLASPLRYKRIKRAANAQSGTEPGPGLTDRIVGGVSLTSSPSIKSSQAIPLH